MTCPHGGLEEELVRKKEFRILNKDVGLNGPTGVAPILDNYE